MGLLAREAERQESVCGEDDDDDETGEVEKGGGERAGFIERESLHMMMVWFRAC